MGLEFYHRWVADSVIHHRIHADSHRVAGQNLFRKTFMNYHLTLDRLYSYLLRRNIKADSSEINFLVSVNTGHDKEKSRTLGAPCTKSPQTEYHGSLILLNNL